MTKAISGRIALPMVIVPKCAHYAEFRTTPSSTIACLFRMILIENYSA
jgi:hypothetical protein